jgi:hypothetical protein
VAGMLMRMGAALAVLLGVGIMTAWAWDRSESGTRVSATSAAYNVQTDTTATADTAAQ